MTGGTPVLLEMDILITEDLQSPAIDALAAKFSVVREPLLWKDAAKLKAALANARTVMVRNQTQLTADVLGAATKLIDRKSTRLNSSHVSESRMPSSA